jgi:hypothetical protein
MIKRGRRFCRRPSCERLLLRVIVFLTWPQKRVPLKSNPKVSAAMMKITKIKIRVSTSTLVPMARNTALARINIAVFILALELRNVEGRLTTSMPG